MGIIMISTRDSFSKLISLVCDDVYTTIGIYYPATANGDNTVCVHLYNTWEKSTPTWVKVYMSDNKSVHIELDNVLTYHLVDKVIMYPIKNEYKNRFKIYFSKIIANEDNQTYDDSFEWLLSRLTGTTYEGSNIVTGYDIINYILKMLDNSKCSRPSGSMELITPNPLLTPTRRNNIAGMRSINNDVFTEQFEQFIDTFKRMYIGSSVFRNRLVELRYGTTLVDYIAVEDNLYECMKKGLSCKDMIESLNQIRDKISKPPLAQEDYYTDKREEIAKELVNFRQDLNKMIDSVNNAQPIVIYLDKFLSHYNNLCNILDITQLSIPQIVSTSSVVTTDINVESNIDTNLITVHASRLDTYSKAELKDILKTINEISIVDSKYIALQNSIVQELSSRT